MNDRSDIGTFIVVVVFVGMAGYLAFHVYGYLLLVIARFIFTTQFGQMIIICFFIWIISRWIINKIFPDYCKVIEVMM